MSNRLDRRTFLQRTGWTLGAASLGLASCADPTRYTDEDRALLAAQRVEEAARAGTGPFGVHRYQGYRGLAELPWFELDDAGVLRMVDASVPKAIDFHGHLGMSMLFKPNLDLLAKTPRVRHLLDCDQTDPGCELDLDVYINANFTEEDLHDLPWTTLTQALWGNDVVETHTIPNLVAEMDATNVEQTVILPIMFGIPFGDDLEASWRAAITESNTADRLLLGTSVHPEGRNKIAELEASAALGTKVVKMHPTVQGFYPDADDAMEVYEAAERLGLTIFFHGGRAGIEPESQHTYAMPRHYEGALSSFPNLNFVIGHGGARDAVAMLELATRYENAWLGIHGQGVTHLDEMIRRTGGERLLFGTDWPFYHLAASLAKVLIVTEDSGRSEIRHAILRGNAERLLSS